MFSTSRKLLSSLTLFAFVFAFAIPLLVMIESANAGPTIEFVRDHTTYYVCRCPDRPLWIIVDCWVDERRAISHYNHPPPKKVLRTDNNGNITVEDEHVFHNITYNMQETWEYSQLGSDDYRCGTIADECEEC